MWNAQVVVMVIVVTSCLANRFSNLLGTNFGPQLNRVPRCPSAAKPCRTRAIMNADFVPAGAREVLSHPCSCQSGDCSADWSNHTHVINRQLRTNGNLTMFFSMKFCSPVQPQSRCQPDQITLQLSGWTPMPTEVDFINCACPRHRPLVLHSITTGADHKQYHAYVCIKHKRKCKRRRQQADTCMVEEPTNHTVRFPCRCRMGYTCQETRTPPHRYTCRR